MCPKEMEEEGSFAELFARHPQMPRSGLVPGDTVSGIVTKISRDTVFVDLGGKSEGLADIEEFRDRDGNLRVKEGDPIELKVASTRRGIHLSKAIKVHGVEALRMLQEAKQQQIPVEGRVAAVNKGGFAVDLSGLQAFCPLSQIDLAYCEKPEDHLGARYQFRITEIAEKGKNIVLSRRALLEEEKDKKEKEILATLQPGLELEGKVTKLIDFGAFVDIGGIEGMVHISEIAHTRIGHPSEVLDPGQKVRVKILRWDQDKAGHPRIALSIKDLEPAAWEKGLPFHEGDVISGRVSRLTDFGAFVEVIPGLDGLVHVSEISYQRIAHPNRVLQEGDRVDVRVMKIDEQKRRLSLSIREAATWQRLTGSAKGTPAGRVEVGQILKGIVEDHKPYGLFVRLPQLGMKGRGLLPIEELLDADRVDLKKKWPPGKEIEVEIVAIDEKGRVRLSEKSIREKEDREGYAQFLQKKKSDEKRNTLGDLFKKLKL